MKEIKKKTEISCRVPAAGFLELYRTTGILLLRRWPPLHHNILLAIQGPEVNIYTFIFICDIF
jgi:hypothetical protein